MDSIGCTYFIYFILRRSIRVDGQVRYGSTRLIARMAFSQCYQLVPNIFFTRKSGTGARVQIIRHTDVYVVWSMDRLHRPRCAARRLHGRRVCVNRGEWHLIFSRICAGSIHRVQHQHLMLADATSRLLVFPFSYLTGSHFPQPHCMVGLVTWTVH